MALTAHETTATLDLPDEHIVVAGDWHADGKWIGRAIPAAARTGARTILHVGDFGFWSGGSAGLLEIVDSWARISRQDAATPGIEHVLVTPGNHEAWPELDALFHAASGHAIRVSETVWILPRGFRFTIAGRTFLSFGGAASIDLEHRIPGRTWWKTELPTREHVDMAIAGGAAEVLITHDVGHTTTPRVSSILGGTSIWSETARAYSDTSRALINDVVVGTAPLLHIHGHYHVRDSIIAEGDGRPPLRVESLNMNGRDGNLVHVQLADLAVTDVEVSR